MNRYQIRLFLFVFCGILAVWGGEEPRVWTSRGGSTFEGTLVGMGMDTVTLRSTEGREIPVRLDALSEQDQAYILTRMERKDRYLARRSRLAEKTSSEEEFLAPMFTEGVWRGALFVFQHANYTYVMNGALEGVLYPATSGPRAVDLPIEALWPLFSQRDPRATGKQARWGQLKVTAVESPSALPAVLTPGPRGPASIALTLSLDNGTQCELVYEFSAEGVRMHGTLADAQREDSYSRWIVKNRFPPAPVETPEEFEALKTFTRDWWLEWKGGVGEVEENGRLEWWNAGKGFRCASIKIKGPWEPWTFAFDQKASGHPLLNVGLYPGFAPYRKGIDLVREAALDEDRLLIDWMFRFER